MPQPNQNNPWFGIPAQISKDFSTTAEAQDYWAQQSAPAGGAEVFESALGHPPQDNTELAAINDYNAGLTASNYVSEPFTQLPQAGAEGVLSPQATVYDQQVNEISSQMGAFADPGAFLSILKSGLAARMQPEQEQLGQSELFNKAGLTGFQTLDDSLRARTNQFIKTGADLAKLIENSEKSFTSIYTALESEYERVSTKQQDLIDRQREVDDDYLKFQRDLFLVERREQLDKEAQILDEQLGRETTLFEEGLGRESLLFQEQLGRETFEFEQGFKEPDTTANITEFNLAKEQGFTGTFLEFIADKSTATRKPVTTPSPETSSDTPTTGLSFDNFIKEKEQELSQSIAFPDDFRTEFENRKSIEQDISTQMQGQVIRGKQEGFNFLTQAIQSNPNATYDDLYVLARAVALDLSIDDVVTFLRSKGFVKPKASSGGMSDADLINSYLNK